MNKRTKIKYQLLRQDAKALFSDEMPLKIRWLLLKSLIMCQINPEVWHQCEIDYSKWKSEKIVKTIGWN